LQQNDAIPHDARSSAIRRDTVADHRKIYLEPERLVPTLESLRAKGASVVFANGCFELLHVGHIRYLAAARALGDCLIVAVNTDASMRKIKPDRRPVIPDHERFEILAALAVVDFIVPLEDRTPAALLHLLRPDIQAKGTDYTLEKIPERVVVEAYGGRVAIVGDEKTHSTTDMLRLLTISAEERSGSPAGTHGGSSHVNPHAGDGPGNEARQRK
jgi:D-beta-D-heptose 7-phosphate kinase/D-beta-D-heptose 1-phosphate adenosyltransferase